MDKSTIDRVRKGLGDSAVGPETIALMLTSVCNFSCAYCRGSRPQNNYSTADELTTEELYTLFLDARTFKVKEINLGGMNGEPFCKKGIMGILAKIKELGFVGSITTNGSFLNEHIAEQLTKLRWDILLLSLDAPREDIQYAMRPANNNKAYFPDITAFLNTLESSQSALRILINMVITKINYRLLPEMVDFANKHRNIESINVLRLIDMGLPAYNDLCLSSQELLEFCVLLKSMKEEKKVIYTANWHENNSHGRQPPKASLTDNSDKKSNRCFTNYYILSMDANGDILQCPQHQVVVDGLNIRKTPLSSLWKNEHEQFRRRLAKHASCFLECCTILQEQNKRIQESTQACR